MFKILRIKLRKYKYGVRFFSYKHIKVKFYD